MTVLHSHCWFTRTLKLQIHFYISPVFRQYRKTYHNFYLTVSKIWANITFIIAITYMKGFKILTRSNRNAKKSFEKVYCKFPNIITNLCYIRDYQDNAYFDETVCQ